MKNSKVKINTIKNLSNDWYKLDKVDFDYQTKDGTWQNQKRESYDRGDGACILLYNSSEIKPSNHVEKVISSHGFRKIYPLHTSENFTDG